jgi:hypothetical protein
MARARVVGAANFLLKCFSEKELITSIENAAAGKPASGSGPFAKKSLRFSFTGMWD